MDKPTCKVHGMIQPGAMCGHVIVGMKYCGFSGECPHKVPVDPKERAGFWDVYEPGKKKIYATVFNESDANHYRSIGCRVVEQSDGGKQS